LLGADVVDDLAFSVKYLIIVVYYHKTCASLHNLQINIDCRWNSNNQQIFNQYRWLEHYYVNLTTI